MYLWQQQSLLRQTMATADDLVFTDVLATEMAAVLDFNKKHLRGDATGSDALEAWLDLLAKRTPHLRRS